MPSLTLHDDGGCWLHASAGPSTLGSWLPSRPMSKRWCFLLCKSDDFWTRDLHCKKNSLLLSEPFLFWSFHCLLSYILYILINCWCFIAVLHDLCWPAKKVNLLGRTWWCFLLCKSSWSRILKWSVISMRFFIGALISCEKTSPSFVHFFRWNNDSSKKNIPSDAL